MKIAFLTTDNREQLKRYEKDLPFFGTAPAAVLEGFKDLGKEIEVHVISCTRRRMNAPEKIADNIWFHQPYVPHLGWGRSLFLGCALTVRRLLKKIDPDIVHGQGTERDCAMGAVLSGYPNVLTIHGNMRVHAKRSENVDSRYYKMASALETFCLKRTDGVVAISSYTQSLVQPLNAKTWLVPNAAESRFFEARHRPPATPRILFVGSMDERKNPLNLLRVCEPLLRKGECTIALAGQIQKNNAYGEELEKAVHSLPGVSALGHIDRQQLVSELASSSMLVLPTFEDNCPMVVLEAMASGLPVAASRVGGIPDLITHDADGLMFDPHDLDDMRSIIERLVRNPELRARLSEAAKAKAQAEFLPRRIAKRHVEIYREVLNR